MGTNAHERKRDKRRAQLGMDPSTASYRLVKDILFKLVVQAGHACFHCNQPLTRETFSIEHKEGWLDSPDPVALFFDQENIAFSHQVCNFRFTRRYQGQVSKTSEAYRKRKWRASRTPEQRAQYNAKRRERYRKQRPAARPERVARKTQRPRQSKDG